VVEGPNPFSLPPNHSVAAASSNSSEQPRAFHRNIRACHAATLESGEGASEEGVTVAELLLSVAARSPRMSGRR